MSDREKNKLVARFKDLADRAYATNCYTFTQFLNPSELAELDEAKREFPFARFRVNGGYEAAERCVACFGDEETFGYAESWPVVVVKVRPLAPKFADELSHRDFLGAVMNLGIKREILGDILVKNGRSAYIICLDNIAPFICENLTRIKHTTVVCEVVEDEADLEKLKPTLIPLSLTVSSLRFDALVAAVTKCSRSETIRLFQSEKVTLNGRVCTENSKQLKNFDIFSIRGYGKFKYNGSSGETRKGRLHAEVLKYD